LEEMLEILNEREKHLKKELGDDEDENEEEES
jgi:hypothetical protein